MGNSFLFENDPLFQDYDYTVDAPEPELLPATLNEAALGWFVSLGINTMETWEDMRKNFLGTCKEYHGGSNTNEGDSFRMQQKEDKSLEDYISRFLKSPHYTPNEELEKFFFLKGINESCTNELYLMVEVDITQVSREGIKQICYNYSRAVSKKERTYQSSMGKSSTNGILNPLTYFKQDVIDNPTTQLDTLQAKDKHEKKKDYRYKMITNNQISLEFKPLRTKEDQVYLVAQRKPWFPSPGMLLNPLSFFGPTQEVNCMQLSPQSQ